MYINRGSLLKIILLLKRVFEFLNKHFYIILIISTLTKYTNNRFSRAIRWLVKLFVFASIIFGVGYIVYFSASEHSIHIGFSLYRDLISNYIDTLINFWKDLMKFSVEETLTSNIRETNKIKNEIRVAVTEGIRDGIHEAIEDLKDQLHEESLNNSNLLKNIAFVTGITILGYFFLGLPGPPISPDDLAQYNWFNQSLIDIKINIYNYFCNTPKGGGIGPDAGINDTISRTASNASTITPCPPGTDFVGSLKEFTNVAVQTTIDSLTVDTQTTIEGVNVGTQTILDGTDITRTMLSLNIVGDVIGQDNLNKIVENTYKLDIPISK